MFHHLQSSPPPSPVDPVTTYSRTSTPNITLESEILLAGFRDCHYEALTYLIEIEHLSLDDPLVVGLQQHLEETEADMYHHQESTTTNANDNNAHVQALLWQQMLNSKHPLLTPTNSELSPSENSSDMSLGSDGVPNSSMSDESDMALDDSTCDDEVERILVNQEYLDGVHEGAQYLDGLARNNGKISCLLNELFGLLDEESADEEEEMTTPQGAGLQVYPHMSS